MIMMWKSRLLATGASFPRKRVVFGTCECSSSSKAHVRIEARTPTTSTTGGGKTLPERKRDGDGRRGANKGSDVRTSSRPSE